MTIDHNVHLRKYGEVNQAAGGCNWVCVNVR